MLGSGFPRPPASVCPLQRRCCGLSRCRGARGCRGQSEHASRGHGSPEQVMGRRGCSADGSARPGAGGGICSPAAPAGGGGGDPPPEATRPPPGSSARSSPVPCGGEVGAGPGERGDLWVWGLGRCGRDPLGTSRDSRRGGWAQRRTCRWRENRGVESESRTPGKDPLIEAISYSI